MANASDFTEQADQFSDDPLYVHASRQVWIRFYPATEVRGAFWQGYRAVKPVPAHRAPWSIDNRRIGTDRGFASLEAAVAAV
jgi:hypothetical protein